ncbi:hypothetical protein Btru_032672 [Bulinus truncatus]|nr:hypothetical protein Btru_032672 [Bulinus truncatus]
MSCLSTTCYYNTSGLSTANKLTMKILSTTAASTSLLDVNAFRLMKCYVNPSISVVSLILNVISAVVFVKSGIRKPANVFLCGLSVADIMSQCYTLSFANILRYFDDAKPFPSLMAWQYQYQLSYFMYVCEKIWDFVGSWGIPKVTVTPSNWDTHLNGERTRSSETKITWIAEPKSLDTRVKPMWVCPTLVVQLAGFGLRCDKKCNCEDPGCKRPNGHCKENVTCLEGYFGTQCQYRDAIFWADVSHEKMKFRGHLKCQRKFTAARPLIIKFDEPVRFTWLQIDAGSTESLLGLNLEFESSANMSCYVGPCLDRRDIYLDNTTLMVLCHIKSDVCRINISMANTKGKRILCSVYVSGVINRKNIYRIRFLNDKNSTIFEKNGELQKVVVFSHSNDQYVKSIEVTLLNISNSYMAVCELEAYGECAPSLYGPDCTDICSLSCVDHICTYEGFCRHCPNGTGGRHCFEGCITWCDEYEEWPDVTPTANIHLNSTHTPYLQYNSLSAEQFWYSVMIVMVFVTVFYIFAEKNLNTAEEEDVKERNVKKTPASTETSEVASTVLSSSSVDSPNFIGKLSYDSDADGYL